MRPKSKKFQFKLTNAGKQLFTGPWKAKYQTKDHTLCFFVHPSEWDLGLVLIDKGSLWDYVMESSSQINQVNAFVSFPFNSCRTTFHIENLLILNILRTF